MLLKMPDSSTNYNLLQNKIKVIHDLILTVLILEFQLEVIHLHTQENKRFHGHGLLVASTTRFLYSYGGWSWFGKIWSKTNFVSKFLLPLTHCHIVRLINNYHHRNSYYKDMTVSWLSCLYNWDPIHRNTIFIMKYGPFVPANQR